MYSGFHVKNLLFFSYFKQTRIFLTDFLKILKTKFHENISRVALFHADRRTDGRKDKQIDGQT